MRLTTDVPRPRIDALDALRGFALCGILLVNIPWSINTIHLRLGPRPGTSYPAVELLELLVHGRFFPLFSFLFGVSFALFLDSAGARTHRPRLVLIRRLVVLGALGVAHQTLHAGEALTPYAIFGLTVLLPASWLPRRATLPVALLVLGAGVYAGGDLLLIPGLFLLGLAAVRIGVIDTLAERRRQLEVVFVVAAGAAVAGAFWQYATAATSPSLDRVSALAGLAGATAYGSGLLLFVGRRPGSLVARALASMGRMALTNYLSATILAIALAPLLQLPHSSHYGRMAGLAAAILLAQAGFSQWWLSRHRYGPCEWVWRCLTWWSRTPNRLPDDARTTQRIA